MERVEAAHRIGELLHEVAAGRPEAEEFSKAGDSLAGETAEQRADARQNRVERTAQRFAERLRKSITSFL